MACVLNGSRLAIAVEGKREHFQTFYTAVLNYTTYVFVLEEQR